MVSTNISLTKPQLAEVAASNLLADSEVWTDHGDGLSWDAGTLAGTVAGPLADAAERRDLADRLGADLLRRRRMPNFLCTLTLLCRCRSHPHDQSTTHPRHFCQPGPTSNLIPT